MLTYESRNFQVSKSCAHVWPQEPWRSGKIGGRDRETYCGLKSFKVLSKLLLLKKKKHTALQRMRETLDVLFSPCHVLISSCHQTRGCKKSVSPFSIWFHLFRHSLHRVGAKFCLWLLVFFFWLYKTGWEYKLQPRPWNQMSSPWRKEGGKVFEVP